jgi:hypothetical protein
MTPKIYFDRFGAVRLQYVDGEYSQPVFFREDRFGRRFLKWRFGLQEDAVRIFRVNDNTEVRHIMFYTNSVENLQ